MGLTAFLLATMIVQTPPVNADPGPAVGQPLPAFEARDQDGRLRSFDSLRGPQGLVLLVYRSADW